MDGSWNIGYQTWAIKNSLNEQKHILNELSLNEIVQMNIVQMNIVQMNHDVNKSVRVTGDI